MVHLFVVHGCQGAEEDAGQLRLTDKLLQAVLAEAQVVCIGQLMLVAGNLNADLVVILCLAVVFCWSVRRPGSGVFSGAGLAPDATCRFSRMKAQVHVRILRRLSQCAGCFRCLLCY